MKVLEHTSDYLKIQSSSGGHSIVVLAAGICLIATGVSQSNPELLREASSEPSFFEQSSRLAVAYLFGILGSIAVLIGTCFIDFTVTYTFDLVTNQLSIKKRFLIRTTQAIHPLQSIHAIQVKWLEDSDSSRYLNISLVKEVGRPIVVSDIVQNQDEVEYQKLAGMIRELLFRNTN